MLRCEVEKNSVAYEIYFPYLKKLQLGNLFSSEAEDEEQSPQLYKFLLLLMILIQYLLPLHPEPRTFYNR
jgi:hypothetical protein